MNDIQITYYGHAMFMVQSAAGVKIVTDPYNEQIKSVLPDVSADIVLVSHDHFDHCNVSLVKGGLKIKKTSEPETIEKIKIEGLNTWHDTNRGQMRGSNIIFKFIVDGVVFAHMGDLGHEPGTDVFEKLADIDVLMIPVGGIYTINASAAFDIAKKIGPAIIIPMHYKEKDSMLQVDKVDAFLSKFDTYSQKEHSVMISKDLLPDKTQVWVLKSS